MPMHRLTAYAAAPPERVFDLWIDLDRMKEWVRGVTRVTDLTARSRESGRATWSGSDR
jgi:uncharacterized protein YndB with AHSA1/START domain